MSGKTSYYFTFGCDSPNRDIYVRVTVPYPCECAVAYEEARGMFMARYGNDWAMQYTDAEVESHRGKEWFLKKSIVDFEDMPPWHSN